MSSFEISKLTGKRHDHVMRDVRELNKGYDKLRLPKIGLMFKITELPNGASRKDPYFELTKMQTFDLLTGYNTELRIKVNRRWAELEEKMILHIPAPKTINGVKCVAYNYWLLQNGYSPTSGQVRARIKKYPEQFCKTKDGWYMSEAIGRYFLDYRNPKERVEALPFVSPKQLRLFDKEELKEMIK